MCRRLRERIDIAEAEITAEIAEADKWKRDHLCLQRHLEDIQSDFAVERNGLHERIAELMERNVRQMEERRQEDLQKSGTSEATLLQNQAPPQNRGGKRRVMLPPQKNLPSSRYSAQTLPTSAVHGSFAPLARQKRARPAAPSSTTRSSSPHHPSQLANNQHPDVQQPVSGSKLNTETPPEILSKGSSTSTTKSSRSTSLAEGPRGTAPPAPSSQDIDTSRLADLFGRASDRSRELEQTVAAQRTQLQETGDRLSTESWRSAQLARGNEEERKQGACKFITCELYHDV